MPVSPRVSDLHPQHSASTFLYKPCNGSHTTESCSEVARAYSRTQTHSSATRRHTQAHTPFVTQRRSSPDRSLSSFVERNRLPVGALRLDRAAAAPVALRVSRAATQHHAIAADLPSNVVHASRHLRASLSGVTAAASCCARFKLFAFELTLCC